MTDGLCREASLALDEPLLGTASVVRRWILIERDGPWGSVALRQNRFDPATRAEIERLRRATGARVLLIRRHAARSQRGVRVMCAYTSPTRKWLEEFRLGSIDELFALDLSPLRRGTSVGGSAVGQDRFFVCTHGKHDPCCAKYGRPVAAALAEKWPDRTWETSHIGGDRFAGNVLVLPAGVYYGRVQPGAAASLMGQLDDGRLSLEHYRGQCAFGFTEQAAEWWARKESQVLRLDDLTLVEHRELEGSETLTRFVTGAGKHVEVRLALTEAPPRRLTCRARRAGTPTRYRVRSVSIEP